jgi:hypothetical protein
MKRYFRVVRRAELDDTTLGGVGLTALERSPQLVDRLECGNIAEVHDALRGAVVLDPRVDGEGPLLPSCRRRRKRLGGRCPLHKRGGGGPRRSAARRTP